MKRFQYEGGLQKMHWEEKGKEVVVCLHADVRSEVNFQERLGHYLYIYSFSF